MTQPDSITKREYSELDRAYDYFNRELFNNQLPPPLITLQRKGRAMGYFHSERFQAVAGRDTVDELALNPDCFGAGDYEMLDTLAHEMCHLWQAHYGKPSRNGYHNAQWVQKMLAIGLMPFDTKVHTLADARRLEPEQIKKTGQQVSDFPLAGGLFERKARELIAAGWHIRWESKPLVSRRQAQKRNKVKYQCPLCAANAWGKPALKLICGDCREWMVVAG